MNSITQLISEYKQAIIFLVKFIGLYLLLNTTYGLYIQSFQTAPDDITLLVSEHTGSFLSIFYPNVGIFYSSFSPYVDLTKDGAVVISVFEGCNSINVLIVFLVFVLAFSKKWYRHYKFIFLSLALLYLINLLRVSLLFWIALEFPHQLYFFHKYLFTGIIYGVVFVLWYFWITKIKKIEPRTSGS